MTKKAERSRQEEPVEPMTEMELALRVFEPKPYPTKMDLWRIALQIPQPPETSAGGIVMPDEYLDRKEFASYVGYVIDMGPMCYTAVTRSGMDLSKAIKCRIGDWVQFGKHDGEKFRRRDGTLYVVLADTQILGVVEDPTEFECLVL